MKRGDFVALATAASVALPAPGRGSSGDVLVWYAADLSGTRVLSKDPDRVLPAASVIKLLIARTLVDAVATSALSLHSRIPLAAHDRVGGSDRFGTSVPGSYAVADLLGAMLSVSDNTASNVLLRYVGRERCNRRAAASGLTATRIRRRFYDWDAQRRGLENTTTPRESAYLLLELARRAGDRGRGGDVALAAMNALLHQTDRETIPAALHRSGIANKTGELPGVRNDVAIVGYGQRHGYVISVMDRYGGARSSAVLAMRSLVGSLDRRLGPVPHDAKQHKEGVPKGALFEAFPATEGAIQ